MTIYNIPNMTTGIDATIIDVAREVNVFIPMFLVFVFGVVFIGGMTSQKKRLGFVDVPLWATLSSLSTFMIALTLTLVQGGIQLEVLVVVVAITIASGIWLFLDRSRHEV